MPAFSVSSNEFVLITIDLFDGDDFRISSLSLILPEQTIATHEIDESSDYLGVTL